MSRYPAASVGDLATLRAAMSSRVSCFKYAQQFDLQKWLVVGNGMERLWLSQTSSPSYPHNVVAELYEAVLGAIYIDAGLARSNTWFAKHIDWPKHHAEAIKRFITAAA